MLCAEYWGADWCAWCGETLLILLNNEDADLCACVGAGARWCTGSGMCCNWGDMAVPRVILPCCWLGNKPNTQYNHITIIGGQHYKHKWKIIMLPYTSLKGENHASACFRPYNAVSLYKLITSLVLYLYYLWQSSSLSSPLGVKNQL